MKVSLSQQERIRLYRLLAAHQADALTLHHVKRFMDQLADFPEDWDQLCQVSRQCRINPDSCPHRDEEFEVSKRAAKVVEELLTGMSKGNRLTAELLSLVEKFAESLLPSNELDEPCPNPIATAK